MSGHKQIILIANSLLIIPINPEPYCIPKIPGSGLMFKNLKIAKAISLFGLLVSIGLGLAVLAGGIALSQLRVSGPIYNQIVMGKDLVADILPPPAYVIEAYLETTLALDDPASVPDRQKRLTQLKADFDARQSFWLAAPLPQPMKDRLTVESYARVQAFWTATDRLMVALKAGDDPAARGLCPAIAGAGGQEGGGRSGACGPGRVRRAGQGGRRGG